MRTSSSAILTPSKERSTSRVKISDRFLRSYKKLDGQLQDRAKKALRKLVQNPRQRSLNFELLRGMEGVYSIRVNDNFRILLQLLEDKEGKYFLALDVANHDIYDRM
jgi:mRNA-degrading endonuclease RelE of RelBE toxin-antitoxin system